MAILDVSQIDEHAARAQGHFQTTLMTSKERLHAYELMRREIAQGRQVYIVLPLVEESEKLDLKSAIEEHPAPGRDGVSRILRWGCSTGACLRQIRMLPSRPFGMERPTFWYLPLW